MDREGSRKDLLCDQEDLISTENLKKQVNLAKIPNIDWENAVDFLKQHKENARKIEQKWSKEKDDLEVRIHF
jgi:nuclear transport factor 2 (NTF2) superfamily protein